MSSKQRDVEEDGADRVRRGWLTPFHRSKWRGSGVAAALAVAVMFLGQVAPALGDCVSPEFDWVRTIGGTEEEWVWDTAVVADAAGNVYIAGAWGDYSGAPGYTVDFDPGAGVDEHISNGGQEAFVTKLNSDGTYGWTRTFGGTGQDIIRAIAVDANSDVYVTGAFRFDVDFDPVSQGGAGDVHTSSASGPAFVTKFNGADGSYGWTTTFGTSSSGNGIAADGAGGVLVTGPRVVDLFVYKLSTANGAVLFPVCRKDRIPNLFPRLIYELHNLTHCGE